MEKKEWEFSGHREKSIISLLEEPNIEIHKRKGKLIKIHFVINSYKVNRENNFIVYRKDYEDNNVVIFSRDIFRKIKKVKTKFFFIKKEEVISNLEFTYISDILIKSDNKDLIRISLENFQKKILNKLKKLDITDFEDVMRFRYKYKQIELVKSFI